MCVSPAFKHILQWFVTFKGGYGETQWTKVNAKMKVKKESVNLLWIM